jgi:pimeloyl-ACP methyl ester carboxylesterase
MKPEQSAAMLANAVTTQLNLTNFKPNYYSSFDKAAAARQRKSKLSAQAAQSLAVRGVVKSEQGFYWHYDRKLLWPSYLYLTSEQVENFLKAIVTEVCLILATDSIMPEAGLQKRMDYLANSQLHRIEGHHHLHLDNPEPVAAAINQYLSKPAQ